MKRALAAAAVLAVAALAAGCAGEDQEPDAAVEGLETGVVAAGLSAEAVGSAGAAISAPGITVTGTGTVTTKPDTAEWSFGVQTSGDTAEAALSANSRAMEKVVAALRGAGISGDDLQTEQVSVYPRISDDGLSIVGYDASNSVRATIHELGAGAGVVEGRVDGRAVLGIGIRDREARAVDLVRARRDGRVDDARARAEAIAEKAGFTLGAPVAIVEGGGGGAVPYYEGALDEARAEVGIEPGTQDVAASLTVTFAIS